MDNITNGTVGFTINNDPKRVIRWNPNDSDFVKRFDALMEYVDGLHDRIQRTLTVFNEFTNLSTDKPLPEVSEESRLAVSDMAVLGVEIAEMVDNTFGSYTSEIVFRGANPVLPAKGGGFLLGNFIAAIIPVIMESAPKNSATFDKGLQKYVDVIDKYNNSRNNAISQRGRGKTRSRKQR